ncbi:MAG: hypothetical protein L0191_04990, partial [Acidobacteria bacterium]|nr:hypothetical protein [Acidobacteriota bacterium]
MTRTTGWLLVSLSAILISPAGPLSAQERGELRAEALFKQGNEAYSKGDFAAAEKAYRDIVG